MEFPKRDLEWQLSPEGMETSRKELEAELALIFADATLKEHILNHPAIGAELVAKYEDALQRLHAAEPIHKADPEDHPKAAVFHRAAGDVFAWGGTLLNKIKELKLQGTMH